MYEKYEDIPKDELELVSQSMIGTALIISCFVIGKNDSNGNPIRPGDYYRVERLKETGMYIIFPTGKNFNTEFKNDIANNILKKQGKLN